MTSNIHDLFFHVDLDAFFASVEQLDHEEYRNKPLIICGAREARGVVSTCSYEAREYGVHSAMPTYQAMQLCPNGIFIPHNMQRYAEKSREVMSVLKDFAPEVNQISIDEASLNMTGTERLLGKPKDTAQRLKDLVKEKTGLTISVGVASNRYLAKIASDINKPNGLTIVPSGGEADFAKKLPLKKIWGIGQSSRTLLQKKGIDNVPRLLELKLDFLKQILGNSLGVFLYSAIRGIDPGIYHTEIKCPSISAERTFPTDLTEEYLLETQLMDLCHELRFRLLEEKLYPKTIGIKIRYSDFSTVSIQQTNSRHFNSAMDLYNTAKELFYKKWAKHLPIRLLGISLRNFETETTKQTELFTNQHDKKQTDLEKAIDSVSKKTKINITKARFLTIIFSFFLIFTNFKTHTQESLKKETTSETLFDWKIGNSLVNFSAQGNWNLEISNLGFSYSTSTFSSNKNLKKSSLLNPVFLQEVDFSLSLTLDDSWFFEGKFQKAFSENYLIAGFKGKDDFFIKEIKIGNKDITIPIKFDDLNFQNVQTNSLGLVGKFGGTKWNAQTLFRVTGVELKEQIFIGKNELTTSVFSPANSIKNKWFILPVNTKDALSKIKKIKIYEENPTGTFLGSDGFKYRELDTTEFIFSSVEGYITLKKTSNKRIAISYQDSGVAFNDTRIIEETKNWFLNGGINIDNYLHSNNEINIANNNCYLIQVPGFFNPLSIQSRYTIPGQVLSNANRENLRLLFNSTKEHITDFSISIISDAFSLIDSQQAWLEISQNNLSFTNDLLFQNPEVRFPFVKNDPRYGTDILSKSYIPGSSAKYDIAIQFILSQDGYILEPDIIQGSIKVYKNGKEDNNFSYNKTTGELKLSSEIAENEMIKVLYSVKSSEKQNTLLETIIAGDWIPTEHTKLKLGTGFQWNIGKKKYIENQETAPIQFTSTGEFSLKNDNLFTGLQTTFIYSNENTTDFFRLQSMKDSLTFTIYPQYYWYFAEAEKRKNLTVWPTICKDGFQIPLVFRNSLDITSTGKTEPKTNSTAEEIIEHSVGPYSIKEEKSSRTSMIMEWLSSENFPDNTQINISSTNKPWTSGYICDTSLETLSQTGRISFALKNISHSHDLFLNPTDFTYDVYLQLGNNVQFLQVEQNKTLLKSAPQVFDTEEREEKILTIKLNNSDTQHSKEVIKSFSTEIKDENKWQTVTIQLAQTDLAKLSNQNAMRFIIVPRIQQIGLDNIAWEAGKFCASIIEGTGSELYTKGDGNSIIEFDPLLTTGKQIKDFEETTNTVLRIEMQDIPNAKTETINYKTPFFLTNYEKAIFYFYTENNFSIDDTLELKIGKSGIVPEEALNLKITLSENNFIYKNQWNKIEIDLTKSEVKINDNTVAQANLKINKDANCSVITWTCTLSDTNNEKKVLYIDELYLKDSQGNYTIKNKLFGEYKNTWQVGDSKINIVADSEIKHLASILPTKSEHIFYGDNELTLTWKNITLNGGFSHIDYEKNDLKEAFHKLKYTSNIFTIEENYRYNKESDFSYHFFNASSKIKNTNISIALFENDISGILKTEKKAKVSFPVFWEKLNLSTTMTMQNWNTKDSSTQKKEIDLSYIDQWTKSVKNQFSTGNNSSKRNIDFSTSLKIDLEKINPNISFFAGSNTDNNSTKNKTVYSTTKILVPFKINDFSITPNISKEITAKSNSSIHSVDETWYSDFSNWGSFFNDTKTAFFSFPFYEIFALKNNSAITNLYETTKEKNLLLNYGLNFQKIQTGKFWDLFLPTSFNTQYTQKIIAQGGEINKRDKISFSSNLTAYNLFGEYGIYPIFNFYLQDQLFQIYQTDLIWNEGKFNFSLTAHQNLTLFFINKGTLQLNNTFSSFEEEYKNSFRTLVKTTGTTSLLEIVLVKVRDFLFSTEIRPEDSDVDKTENLQEQEETEKKFTSPYFQKIITSKPRIEREEALSILTNSKKIYEERKTDWSIVLEHKTNVSFAEKLGIYVGINFLANLNYEKILSGNLTGKIGLELNF